MKNRKNNSAQRRLRAAAFLRKNGLIIAAALCLAVLGGFSALILGSGKKGPEAPAESSLDERLGEAANSARPTEQSAWIPFFTNKPDKPSATPAPTVIPDITPAPSVSPGPTEPVKYNSPVDGRLIRPYSMDGLIYSKTLDQWMTHSGVDVAAVKGAEVRSVAAGAVERVYKDDMLGVTVVIDHGGFKTLYCGLKEDPPVKEKDKVEAGSLIGYVGNTALFECSEESHLHFEVIKEGRHVDPEAFVLFKKDGE